MGAFPLFFFVMDSTLHSLELSLWRDPCPIAQRIPSTSTVIGYVDKGRYISTLGHITLSLPLIWHTMLWITCILQHHAVYRAGFGGLGHIFASLVWFYDGLIHHLAVEASKLSFIMEDWSLPAWDRFMTRIRLGIGHSPLALYTFQNQLAEAYADQPTIWYQGLIILMPARKVILTCIGLHLAIKVDPISWKACLLTVAQQHFQDGLPAGFSTKQEWVEIQYKLLLDDLQPTYGSESVKCERRSVLHANRHNVNSDF